MPTFTQTAGVVMLTVIQAGAAASASSASDEPICAQVVWDDSDEAGTDAEWAQIARSAPRSDRIRAIAKYLLETGQAAT